MFSRPLNCSITDIIERYEPCPRVYFQESFDHVLQCANDPSSIHLDRLALVFAIVSHGALVDLKQKPYNIYALELHQLSRASLSLTPFLEGRLHFVKGLRPAYFMTRRTLFALHSDIGNTTHHSSFHSSFSFIRQFLLGLFFVLSNKKNGPNQAWLVHCLACKVRRLCS